MKIKNGFKEILTKYNKERKKRIIIVLILSSLFVFYALITKETSHYGNPKANLKWTALIDKYPDDMPLHTLHALRLGLRMKVERGDINLNEATEIFEKIKKLLIKKKKRLESNSKKHALRNI